MATGQMGTTETRKALIVIGLGMLLADLLVVFFMPAAFRIGRQGTFTVIIVALALVGFVLVLVGRQRRRL